MSSLRAWEIRWPQTRVDLASNVKIPYFHTRLDTRSTTPSSLDEPQSFDGWFVHSVVVSNPINLTHHRVSHAPNNLDTVITERGLSLFCVCLSRDIQRIDTIRYGIFQFLRFLQSNRATHFGEKKEMNSNF